MKEFIIAKLENNYCKEPVEYRCFSFDNWDSEIDDIVEAEDCKNGTEIKDGCLYIYGANFYNKFTDEFMGTNTVKVTFKFTDKFIDKWDYEKVSDFRNDCEKLFDEETEIYEMKFAS